MIEIDEKLGASNLLGTVNDEDEARTHGNFAALCELVAPAGLYPHLEFMPWTGIKALHQARRVVQAYRD